MIRNVKLQNAYCKPEYQEVAPLDGVKTSIFRYLHTFIASSIPTHFLTTILLEICVRRTCFICFLKEQALFNLFVLSKAVLCVGWSWSMLYYLEGQLFIDHIIFGIISLVWPKNETKK